MGTASRWHSRPDESYCRDLRRFRGLTRHEEIELGRKAGAGDAEARNRLVVGNLRLAVKVARRLAVPGVDLTDMIQAGNVGLIRAAEKYDPDRGIRFSTYAVWWIRHYIQQAIRMSQGFPLTAFAVDRLCQWHRAEAALRSELGRPPTSDEVASSLGWTPRQLLNVRKALELSPVEGRGGPRTDLIIDPKTDRGRSGWLDGEDAAESLGVLGADELRVVRKRYGLDGNGRQTLAEIGADLGLSRERVRQIELRGLEKLREFLEG